MRVIEAAGILEAWREGTELLMACPKMLNISLSIDTPCDVGERWDAAVALVDAFLDAENQTSSKAVYPLHTVAETIFPGWQYQHRGLHGVFEVYPNEEYPRVKQRWGTYAYRLVRRTDKDGKTFNPLERMIEKMKKQIGREGGTNAACYELGVAEGEFDLPLYSDIRDYNRHLGGPCLSHLSFKLLDGKVHLAAMYRSHDYRWKVLGNLLGLARLLACVSKEVGYEPGTLVVHSTFATLEGSRAPMRALLDELRKLTAGEAA